MDAQADLSTEDRLGGLRGIITFPALHALWQSGWDIDPLASSHPSFQAQMTALWILFILW